MGINGITVARITELASIVKIMASIKLLFSIPSNITVIFKAVVKFSINFFAYFAYVEIFRFFENGKEFYLDE